MRDERRRRRGTSRGTALLALTIAAVAIIAAAGAPPRAGGGDAAPWVLVFTKTAGFRHDSIPAGIECVQRLGREHGFEVRATEDASAFTTDGLRGCAAAIFLNTSGDVLDDAQQAALRAYVEGGGGFVGIHAATDTEHAWPWYRTLVGARFSGHPAVQLAELIVVDAAHPSTAHLPPRWTRTDEWYDFDAPPGEGFTILLRLDESTYEGGKMKHDHPAAWCRAIGRGRSWYTAGGHTSASFDEPAFVKHLAGGIDWVRRRGKVENRK